MWLLPSNGTPLTANRHKISLFSFSHRTYCHTLRTKRSGKVLKGVLQSGLVCIGLQCCPDVLALLPALLEWSKLHVCELQH